MGKNTFQLIHKGKVLGETTIFVQLPDGEIKSIPVNSNIVYTDQDGKGLMQVKHEAVAVGKSIAQIKRSTTVKVTDRGTVIVSQVKSEISSRGEDIYFYDNSLGTYEGTLEDAQRLFKDVDFSDLVVTDIVDRSNPEFKNLSIVSPDQAVSWQEISRYDAEENGGKPTTWAAWADGLQTGLDVIGLIPGIGEFADGINGCISLARGNYGDAAMNFAAMVPGFGMAATIAKQAKKIKKGTEKVDGVYDLILKNTDNIEEGYIGMSKNVFKRFKQHFGSKGKLKDLTEVLDAKIYKPTKNIGSFGKKQKEMYEQYVILQRHGDDWKDAKYLLNKVNPVGGRYKLDTAKGLKEFYKDANELIEKFGLEKIKKGL